MIKAHPPQRHVEVQAEDHRPRDPRPGHPGQDPEQQQLAEDEAEDGPSWPAGTSQHPDLSSPPSDRRHAAVDQEQRGDHQDQDKEGHRGAVEGGDDHQRHPQVHPILMEQQRRSAVLPGGKSDGLGGGGGAGGGDRAEPRLLLDPVGDLGHMGELLRDGPSQAPYPDPNGARNASPDRRVSPTSASSEGQSPDSSSSM
jgi:hypothetical protein